ncbi:hypothetical protein K7711_36505 [Nocardia sp. CA2R105]|uniref:hypothetical protein n=1 Tax=Nocardia coffeae TaxID=2873381 RepID=UPI001CA78AA4|nr:hypothetical protein [Nocardia coffeae]MBY8862026.1 hypothetical protein [Nocardia coffeae]
MTGPDVSVTRAAQVPPEQASLLREIQHLAAVGAELTHQLNHSDVDYSAMTRTVGQQSQIDQHRACAEIAARIAGAPDTWIARVRRLGEQGHQWHADQLLPNPVTSGRRGAITQIAADIRHLIDMAALAAARQHHAIRNSVDEQGNSADSENVDSRRFDRNMFEIWIRAGRIAQSAGLTGHERARLWSVSDKDWTHHLAQVLRFAPTDVEAVWQRYASPELGQQVEISLNDLRHHMLGIAISGPHAETEQLPPPPSVFVSRAHHALHTVIEHQPPGTSAIHTAITDALPDNPATRAWEPEPECEDTGPVDPGSLRGNAAVDPEP